MMRKIFNYDDLKESKIQRDYSQAYENSISAGGCLFYQQHEEHLKLLLILKTSVPSGSCVAGLLDDLGGKVDPTDQTIEETIKREVREESNDLIHLESLIDCMVFYNKATKYYSVVKRVDSGFFPDTSVFGTHEKTTTPTPTSTPIPTTTTTLTSSVPSNQIQRTINWYDWDDVKLRLSPRLTSNLVLMTFLSQKAGQPLKQDLYHPVFSLVSSSSSSVIKKIDIPRRAQAQAQAHPKSTQNALPKSASKHVIKEMYLFCCSNPHLNGIKVGLKTLDQILSDLNHSKSIDGLQLLPEFIRRIPSTRRDTCLVYLGQIHTEDGFYQGSLGDFLQQIGSDIWTEEKVIDQSIISLEVAPTTPDRIETLS